MKPPTIVTLDIREIKPYWRNPRENHDAVQKVKQSIARYGYNQLIAVDQKNVIIAGHTRYNALKELGWNQVPVQKLDLTEKEAKAYRIVDNKTAEFAKWTPDNLASELRELGSDLPDLQSFFLEDLGSLMEQSVGVNGKDVTAGDVKKTEERLATRFGYGSDIHKASEKEMCCPECGHTYFVSGN